MSILHLFIVNPKAGKGHTQKRLPELIRSAARALGEEAEIYETVGHGDAERRVREAAETGRELRVYACGGDGTLNGVVNGAFGYENVSVGVYPCGSGNDFVKMLPAPEKCLDIPSLLRAEARPCDLLDVNGRKCINMSNFGFDALVVHTMQAIKRFPLISGPLAYTLAAIASLASRMGYGVTARFDDGEVFKGDLLLGAVGSGAVCGGKFRALPRAVLDDGELDGCLVRKVSRPKFASLLGCYAAGEHVNDPRLRDTVLYRRLKSLVIDSNRTAYLALDGELLSGTHFEYKILPRSVRVIMPE